MCWNSRCTGCYVMWEQLSLQNMNKLAFGKWIAIGDHCYALISNERSADGTYIEISISKSFSKKALRFTWRLHCSCSTRTLYKKCLSLKKKKKTPTLFLFIFQLITFYCGHDLYSLRVKWQDYTPTSSRCLPILENTAQLDTSLRVLGLFAKVCPVLGLQTLCKVCTLHTAIMQMTL